MKLNKKIVVGVVLVCVVLGVFVLKKTSIGDKVYFLSNTKKETKLVEAEQSGSSPESGATSRLKSAYDGLVSKGTNYGDSQPADWEFPSYGTYWDRILYAAAWEPDGTAIEYNVLEGKTFYSGDDDRDIKTGTGQQTTIDFSQHQYEDFDDRDGADWEGGETVWVNTNSTPSTEVWYDTETGLYWARSQPASLTNQFNVSTCDFFTSSPRGIYSGGDANCGDAINACANLSLAIYTGGSAYTDWYLPSLTELSMAYVDGIRNQTSSAFEGGGCYLSSTQVSTDSGASFCQFTSYPRTFPGGKEYGQAVRCVRRD